MVSWGLLGDLFIQVTLGSMYKRMYVGHNAQDIVGPYERKKCQVPLFNEAKKMIMIMMVGSLIYKCIVEQK